MKNIVLALLGLLVMIAAFWVGAYLMYVFPDYAWQRLPVFVTCAVVGAIGLVGMACCLSSAVCGNKSRRVRAYSEIEEG